MAAEDFFKTGKFTAAELAGMRAKADKPRALYEIGQYLRRTRLAAKLQRSAVAARCDVAADQLGRFEHGASDIGFAALDRYCGLLDIDVAMVLRPHLKGDPTSVDALIELARSWTSAGKPLPISELVGHAGPN